MLQKERLILAVKESPKSKEEIASESGITVQTLYTYLNGKRDPNTRTLGLLAKSLERSSAWLLGETDNPSPEAQKALKDYTKEVQRIHNEPFSDWKIDPEQASKMTREEIEEAKRITERNIIKIELEEAKELLTKRLAQLNSQGE